MKMQTHVHDGITIRVIPYPSTPMIFITSDASNKFGHLFLLNNLVDPNTAHISKLFGDVEKEGAYSSLLHELLKSLLKRNCAMMHQAPEQDCSATLTINNKSWNRAVVSVAIKDKELMVKATDALQRINW
jgi:hypothetical protein